jgi:HEPN domain-containing protein
LFIAGSELEGIRVLAERQISYGLCMSKLAEVVEKIFKAELLRLGWFLEKTHDLEKLANELQARRSDLIAEARPLATSLAEAYFSERYPGFDLEDPDWPTFTQRLAQVEVLFQKVEQRVRSTGARS